MNKQTELFDIKQFEWEELHGKELRIIAGKQDGAIMVVGHDKEANIYYVLHEELTKIREHKLKETFEWCIRESPWGDAQNALDKIVNKMRDTITNLYPEGEGPSET